MLSHMLRFHLIGDFPPGRVCCGFVPSTFHPGRQVQSIIDTAWAAAKSRLGDKLFDGPMCRLESYQVAANALHLTLSRVSYKGFLGTNLAHSELAEEFGQEALANPVGLSCALVAADGFLMMGRRNSTVAYYPNRVHPFAGALEPEDGGDRERTDVFAEVRRELKEELSFDGPDIADMRCMGLVEDRSLRQPELVFLVRSTLARGQIESQLDATEHQATYVVDPTRSAAEAALRERTLLTPVGTATLLLWGRVTLGVQWFGAAAAAFTAE